MARRPLLQIEPEIDPVDDVVREDRFNTAQALTDALDSLSGYDAGSIKGILFKVPKGGGKYETIETIFPPFDPDAMVEDLKERFGGGDYLLRIMEIGKPGVKKNINFSIAKERESLIARDRSAPSDQFQMMQFMLQMQNESRREMAEAQRQSNDRLLTLAGIAIPALVPLFTNREPREKVSELMTAIAAMQPKPEDASKTFALLTQAKELFGGGEKSGPSGDDIADMAKGAMSMVGPMVRGAADMFRSRSHGQDAAQDHDAAPLMLPGSAPTTPAEGQGPAAGPSRYRVIDVVRDDVLYCFMRGHDPAKAADLAYDAIEAADVTDEEIAELVAAYTLSADPLGELATEGLDLRMRPEWANAFLAELVAIHGSADVGGDDDHSRGGSGGAGDDAPDGEAGAQGVG